MIRKINPYTGGRPTPKMVEADNGVIYFTFEHFERTGLVKHAFTSRLGGVSKGCFESLNLCMTRGDDEKDVLENHRLMAEALGYNMGQVVHSAQTHTDHVIVVDGSMAGNGVTKPQKLQDVDGMITNVPGLMLMTFYADCTPILLLDPVRKVVGECHAGWKGTRLAIAAKTVRLMEETYGSRPEDILAAIAPSICQDCYEVSADLLDAFTESFGAEECGHFFNAGQRPGHYQLNLWEANYRILTGAGLLPEHIEVTDLCTRCNPDLFYSHRVMGNARGNLAAIIGLKE